MAKKATATPSIDSGLIQGEGLVYGSMMGIPDMAQGFDETFGKFVEIAADLQKEREAEEKERKGIINQMKAALYELPEYDPESTNLIGGIEKGVSDALEQESKTASEIVNKLSKLNDLNSDEALVLKKELNDTKKRMNQVIADATLLDKELREQGADIAAGNFSRAANPELNKLMLQIAKGEARMYYKNGRLKFAHNINDPYIEEYQLPDQTKTVEVTDASGTKTVEMPVAGETRRVEKVSYLGVADIFEEAALQKENIESATTIESARKAAAASASVGKFGMLEENETTNAIKLATRDLSNEQFLSLVVDDLFIGGPLESNVSVEKLRRQITENPQEFRNKYTQQLIDVALVGAREELKNYETKQQQLAAKEAYENTFNPGERGTIEYVKANFGQAPDLKIGNAIYSWRPEKVGYVKTQQKTKDETYIEVDSNKVFKNPQSLLAFGLASGAYFKYTDESTLSKEQIAYLNSQVNTPTKPESPESTTQLTQEQIASASKSPSGKYLKYMNSYYTLDGKFVEKIKK